MKKTKKLLTYYFIIVFIILNIIWLFYKAGLFEKMELGYYDSGFFLMDKLGRTPSKGDIVVIKLDNKSVDKIAKLGKSVTEIRDVYGYIVKKAYENGAKLVSFDIMFQSFSNDSPADLYFKDTIKNSPGVVFAAFADNGKSADITFPNGNFLDINSKNGIGLINMYLDKDNKSRESAVFFQKDGYTYPGFAFEIFRRVNNINSIADLDSYFEKKGSVKEGKILINYRAGTIMGNSERISFDSVSIADIIDEAIGNKKFDYSIFKNKIVIIGATYSTGQDFYMTPFNKIKDGASRVSSPGVEIHAQLLNTLLQNREITKLKTYYIVFIIFGILLSLLYIPIYKKTGISFLFFIFSTILIISISQILFYYDKTADSVQFLMANTVLYIYSISFKTIWERSEKKRIQEIFGKYVAKSIVDDVIQSGDEISVGGKLCNATILFADIEGFTSISEKCADKPGKLVEYLNIYFDKAIDTVDKNGGMVDKMIGDAVMALFGLPYPNGNHAEMGINSAIGLKKVAEEVSKLWEKELGTSLKIRVGVNSGDVIAGNIGSKSKKIEYTVIGDNVNLSSRLEGVNKYYGTAIIISEAVYNKIEDKNRYFLREIDLIRVKGKNEAVKIFEVIDFNKNITEVQKTNLKIFEEALLFYRNMEFQKARDNFKNLDDSVSKLYLKRCDEYILIPPNQEWDGVYTLKSK